MKLGIKERILVMGMMPQNGKLQDMVEILDLTKKVKIGIEEAGEIQMQEFEDGRISWDRTKDVEKEVELTADQVKILKDASKKLDEEGKVDLMNLELCLKINSL